MFRKKEEKKPCVFWKVVFWRSKAVWRSRNRSQLCHGTKRCPIPFSLVFEKHSHTAPFIIRDEQRVVFQNRSFFRKRPVQKKGIVQELSLTVFGDSFQMCKSLMGQISVLESLPSLLPNFCNYSKEEKKATGI